MTGLVQKILHLCKKGLLLDCRMLDHHMEERRRIVKEYVSTILNRQKQEGTHEALIYTEGLEANMNALLVYKVSYRRC